MTVPETVAAVSVPHVVLWVLSLASQRQKRSTSLLGTTRTSSLPAVLHKARHPRTWISQSRTPSPKHNSTVTKPRLQQSLASVTSAPTNQTVPAPVDYRMAAAQCPWQATRLTLWRGQRARLPLPPAPPPPLSMGPTRKRQLPRFRPMAAPCLVRCGQTASPMVSVGYRRTPPHLIRTLALPLLPLYHAHIPALPSTVLADCSAQSCTRT